jgi:hypothetical protein
MIRVRAWGLAFLLATLAGCAGTQQRMATQAPGPAGFRRPSDAVLDVQSGPTGLSKYFPGLPGRTAAPVASAAPATKRTGLLSYNPVERFEARRAAWTSRWAAKVSTPAAAPIASPRRAEARPTNEASSPPMLPESIHVVVHPDDEPSRNPAHSQRGTTTVASYSALPMPRTPVINPIAIPPPTRDNAARQAGARPDDGKPQVSRADDSQSPAARGEDNKAAEIGSGGTMDQPSRVEQPKPDRRSSEATTRAGSEPPPNNRRLRLLPRTPECLPPDLPAVSFPRSYYETTAETNQAAAAQPDSAVRPWRPRLFRSWWTATDAKPSPSSPLGSSEADRLAQGR